MNWLARLKKAQIPPDMDATNATKPGFVGFVASIPAPIQKTQALSPAANDPAQAVGRLVNPVPAALADTQMLVVSSTAAAIDDPDRWGWPHSSAITGREIDALIERTSLFIRRGLPALEAELLADKLTRDRDWDDRRLCLECAHLSGRAGAMRCARWQRAGLGQAGIPAGLALQLQRCSGFEDQNPANKPHEINDF